MANGQSAAPVAVVTPDPAASTFDYLPLDDSGDSDDSSSDVPMTVETDEEDNVDVSIAQEGAQLNQAATASNNIVEMHNGLARKRKSSDDASDDSSQRVLDPVKRVKLADPEPKGHCQRDDNFLSDRSTLPGEIWQHIFTFCPPRILGRLLQVNRLFNVYLDPSSTIQCERPRPLPKTAVPMIMPNSVWQASRRRFWPSMPSSLQDQTELSMWQLSCSLSCQHCGSRMPQQQESSDPWQPGPGKDGVAIVWPFATRSCGPCLLTNSTKEIDILLSPTIPSTLTTALPFVFVTKELHAVSPATVERVQPPSTGTMTKLYWSTHVEELEKEFLNVKLMGSATADEWLKGLKGRGNERRNDASRWEKWASVNGGLKQMRTILYPGYQPPKFISNGGNASSAGTSSLSNRIPGISNADNNGPAAAPSVTSNLRSGLTPEPSRRSSSGNVAYPSGRHDRSKEEVAEIKAARKAEIERRAFLLDPPLPAHVLAHIPAFQAALQIITPMDDQGWEVLKPRLISQRADAEQRNKENAARVRQEAHEERNPNNVAKDPREARDADDSDWDEAQAPVRARIFGYAEEIIRDGWDGGDKIGRENCAKFAVEALTYIRKRFYAEIAKDVAAAHAAAKPPIVDPPRGPFTQKLTLDNMKWIFDVKIRPLAERYGKEIFWCNGCDSTVRSYGFEGVIQHYSAKHASGALSLGNVVVHWKAEWPEHPPFTSEPKMAKDPHQSQTTPGAYLVTHNPQQHGHLQPLQSPGGGPMPGYAPYPATGVGFAPPQGYGATPHTHTDVYQSYAPAAAQQTGYIGPAQSDPGRPNHFNYGAYHNNASLGHQYIQPSPFSAQYTTQIEDMAHIARDLWNATANMKDTLSIVRVQVVVYHLAKRFHAKFGMPLPLPTFIDGLSNHKDMRPVRNVNGLVCRVCHQAIGGYVASVEERKSWSLPQLTAHFQAKHVEPFVQMGQYGQPPEWTVDMVLLPDPIAVSNLRASIGMDGQKYHLVNEAVPHLLVPPTLPSDVAQGPSAWHHQASQYPSYQAVAHDHSALPYGQSQADGPTQAQAAGQYASGFGPAPQYPHEPTPAYSHAEQHITSNNPIIPADVYSAPEPVPTVHASVPLSRSDSGNRSGQGLRQRRKNTKKKGNKRENGDEEERRRIEEEEKMAEEEAARGEAEVRAMWANDRARAASKAVFSEGQQVGNQGHASKPSNASKSESKPNTPKPNRRFQSRAPRNSPRRDVLASPLRGAGDKHVGHEAPTQHGAVQRGHTLSNVAYADGNRGEPSRQEWQRSPDRRDHYGPPIPVRPRSRSPVYHEQSRALADEHYRQRSPIRQHPDQADYQPKPPVPIDDVRYDREPPSRNDYGSYGPPGSAPDIIEYEVLEYHNPDGTITIEERPIRRMTKSEAEQYYRDAPPSAMAPYDRGHPLPPPPSSYRRDQPPPPPAGEPYYPAYDRAYSLAPPPPPSQHIGGAEAYDPRYPSNAPLQRNGPPPPPPRAEPAYYENEEYDPRFPNGPPNMPVVPPRPNYR